MPSVHASRTAWHTATRACSPAVESAGAAQPGEGAAAGGDGAQELGGLLGVGLHGRGGSGCGDRSALSSARRVGLRRQVGTVLGAAGGHQQAQALQAKYDAHGIMCPWASVHVRML